MVIVAVARNFEVIGEAATHISDEIKSAHPEIPWLEMRGMRNIIAHQYFGVDLKIVWKTVEQSLPPLLKSIQKILVTLG